MQSPAEIMWHRLRPTDRRSLAGQQHRSIGCSGRGLVLFHVVGLARPTHTRRKTLTPRFTSR